MGFVGLISRVKLLCVCAAILGAQFRQAGAAELSSYQIGYTQFRTNLPAGRQANVVTRRAQMMRGDGTDRRQLGADLIPNQDTWTEFAGWSPDGKTAIIGNGFDSAENQ